MAHRKDFAAAPDTSPGAPKDLPSDPALTYNPKRSTLLGGLGSTLPTRLEVPQPAPSPGAPPPGRKGFEGVSLPLLPDADFSLDERIARGGFGDVWKGRQPSLGREVAIKRLRDDRLVGVADEERRNLEAMFRHEAWTTARLEHPNIVPVYQLGRDSEGRTLLGMKWVRGRRWSRLIREELGLPIDEFLARHLAILIDVAQAVAFAHSQGVLHRDLKPQQVMVGAFGEVQLMDWGLALLYGQQAPALPASGSWEDGGSGSFQSSGVMGPAGTPCFMAPEQTREDGVDLGPKTDLYLLGGCLYYLLTGAPTHGGQNGLVAFVRASQGEVVPVRERAPERPIPNELCELVEGVLAADPKERRPETVEGLVEALQAYLSGATRRQRAGRLVEQVTAELEGGPAADYDALGELLEQVREAESLWPDHPEVDPLRQRLRRRFGEAALERGDLALARLQVSHLGAGAVPSDPRNDQLRSRVEQAIEQRRRQGLQRRFTLAALALVVLLATLGFAWQERRANARLRFERDVAEAARADAEGLMGFLLDDLWDRMIEIGRLDLLAPVARRAEAHYRDLDLASSQPVERLNFGKMFLTIGDTLRYEGDTEGAVQAYRRGLEIFRGLEETEGGAGAVLERRLDGMLWLANALNDLGESEESIALQGEILELLDGAQGILDDEDALAIRVSSVDGLGITHYDRGDLEQAQDAFERAVALGREARRNHPTLQPGVVTGPLVRLAVTLADRDRPEAALVLVEEALALEAQTGDSEAGGAEWSFSWFAASIHGEILAELGRWDEAVRVMREFEPGLRARVESDPGNAEVRYLAAMLLLQIGNSESARGEGAAAKAAWESVLDLVEPVRDESSMTYFDDVLVRALVALGRVDEARPVAEGLLAIDWRHQDFAEFWRRHGGASSPPPPPR